MPAKHRSPAYPAVDLRVAVELVEKLYPQATKHAIGGDVVAELWEYKNVLSASPYIAAVKQYGLLKEERSGAERMLRLTDDARDIAVDKGGNSRERREALRRSAIHPAAFADMWNKWEKHLPPESEMRRYLEREREFNPKYVGRVVANYRASLEFAKLIGNGEHEALVPSDENYSPAVDTCNNGNGSEDSIERGRVESVKLPPEKPPMSPSSHQDVFTLSSGDVVLQWPSRLTKEEYEDTEGWLDLIKRKLKRAVADNPSSTDSGEKA